MTETIEIPLDDFKKLARLGKIAIRIGFAQIVIMLFHVLVDFFYHA